MCISFSLQKLKIELRAAFLFYLFFIYIFFFNLNFWKCKGRLTQLYLHSSLFLIKAYLDQLDL